MKMPKWKKATPKHNWTVDSNYSYCGTWMLRGRKVRSVRGLRKPGSWMPTPQILGDPGRMMIFSCPYKDCGKILRAEREVWERHSLICPRCGRHIWLWVQGPHHVPEDRPFGVTLRNAKGEKHEAKTGLVRRRRKRSRL